MSEVHHIHCSPGQARQTYPLIIFDLLGTLLHRRIVPSFLPYVSSPGSLLVLPLAALSELPEGRCFAFLKITPPVPIH